DTVEVAVQINGKIKAKLLLDSDISSENAISFARNDEKVAEELRGKTIMKEIYVKGKLINIVAK
ncbi:MAG: hypothetical protein RR177_06730, partial [Oscillospiraceae bacterium]